MPNSKKKIVMPVVAALLFVLVLWLAFRDRSTEPVPVKSSQAVAVRRVALSPGEPSRTRARSADPASSRS